MATIILQAAGGLLGGLIGGPFGAVLGRALGGLGGYAIDSALFGQSRSVEGARLGASRILEADEGGGIARVYGTARVAGQIIWTTRFEESRETERQGGKGSAGETEVTTYSYFGNVAIGLCEGVIAGVRRIWADGEELDLEEIEFRVHAGGEDQQPDPLIELKQGEGNAPAYRGLAYVVFERLPLERWGNRIPQISCEVIRPIGQLERQIRAVTIIPGATEHGLDPKPVRERVDDGEDRTLNRNVLYGRSDFTASLDELQRLCPKLERAALVVSWFGDDLRAGHCTIRPGVEVAARDETTEWRVGGIGRAGARLISRYAGGPAFGGTPSDGGVARAIADLTARGLKVTFYPFVMIDIAQGNALPDPYGGVEQAPFPWRGRITLDVATGRAGSPDGTAAAGAAVTAFLGAAAADDFDVEGPGEVAYRGPVEWSYRRMVLHQAHLCASAGGVAAFVIGSELRGLTRIRDAAGRFPFVEGLMALAGDVKAILPDATITYAADWSEYFGYHPDDGSGDVFFNLDPLWANPAIGAVGIDNYLPLTDWRTEDWDGGGDASSPYDSAALAAGIAGGEYFDWYYADEGERAQRLRRPISDGAAGKPWVFRPKDLVGWWSSRHFDRRGGIEVAQPSAWDPKSKPIWFTELGCPAIDKGANQPNVFVDPKSSEDALPHRSAGARDDLMQRSFLEAHLRRWDEGDPSFEEARNPVSPLYGGRMVDAAAIHLWTWDARPYPAFPVRSDVWSDGANWKRGHWLTGRLGNAPVDALIATLLADHGLTVVDASDVAACVGGYVIGEPGTAREQLEGLLRLTGTSVFASAGGLVFRSQRHGRVPQLLDSLVDEDDVPLLELRRSQAEETPEEVLIGYQDPARSYQPAAAEAGIGATTVRRQDRIVLPVTLSEEEARRFARGALADGLASRDTARLQLSPALVGIEPGEVVWLEQTPGRWQVTRIESGLARRLELRRLPGQQAETVDEEPTGGLTLLRPTIPSRPLVHYLDLPMPEGGAPTDGARIAVHSRPWSPWSVSASVEEMGFSRRGTVSDPATVGRSTTALPPGPEAALDRMNVIEVELSRGALFSISRDRLDAGGNLCAVACGNGGWEVLQFETADEVAPRRFRLAGLVRALGGTEDAMNAGAAVGAAFVLLDGATPAIGITAAEIGRRLFWQVSPAGYRLGNIAAETRAVALGRRAVLPLSPVHLRGVFRPSGALELSWIRRTRTGGNGWDGIDVPLGEEIERYRVTVSAEAGQVVRDTETAALNLTAAEQVDGFGGLPAGLTVTVAQLSLTHGPGTGRTQRFERPL
ncbi:baseplate multidomain protein megatron [Mangrovicella endophytica]|uniref:baseplate multidomain protein megatron n=1 Tax=Mangrovicella endophytica TaxID=2066697 RepID=UPI000C9DB71E|nr:glycoside hydrolase/phage tail family protein [Mangrovicella endophytica]